MLAQDALAATAARGNPAHAIATARFFATNLATAAPGLATTVIEGADGLRIDPDDDRIDAMSRARHRHR